MSRRLDDIFIVKIRSPLRKLFTTQPNQLSIIFFGDSRNIGQLDYSPHCFIVCFHPVLNFEFDDVDE